MLNRCPHCGLELSKPLKDGLSSCVRCNAVFESSRRNKLLSGAWDIIRSRHPVSLDRFKFETKLKEYEAIFVYSYIGEHGFCMDEFRQVLNDLGI